VISKVKQRDDPCRWGLICKLPELQDVDHALNIARPRRTSDRWDLGLVEVLSRPTENFILKVPVWAGPHFDEMDTTLMTFHLYVAPDLFLAILSFAFIFVLLWACLDLV